MSYKNNALIISPSGNFYGSEQVLFDFLRASNNIYQVYVPRKSVLERKLKQEHKHKIKTFKSLAILYIKLTIVLLIKNYTLYINEGGHVKYLKLLAKLFPNRKFVLQIRLLTDTDHIRLKDLPLNVCVVCVSKFIANNIPSKYKPIVLNDPFELPHPLENKNNLEFNIGFIGRVTPTKGLKEVSVLLNELETMDIKINIYFFGSVETNKIEVNQFTSQCQNYKCLKVVFKGFVDDKKDIYKNINLVVHLNKEEAFPRVALESWAYGVPLIGFDAGGVGEINDLLKVSDFLIPLDVNWVNCLIEKIAEIRKNYPVSSVQVAQQEIRTNLNLKNFTHSLEELIH